MSKQSKNAFSKIPSNQPANKPQHTLVRWALSNAYCKSNNLEIKRDADGNLKFNKYGKEDFVDGFIFARRFGAIINEVHTKAGKPLTHGDVQKLSKVTEVPQKYLDKLKVSESKARSKSPTKKQLEQDKQNLLDLLKLNGIELPNDDEDSKQLDLFE